MGVEFLNKKINDILVNYDRDLQHRYMSFLMIFLYIIFGFVFEINNRIEYKLFILIIVISLLPYLLMYSILGIEKYLKWGKNKYENIYQEVPVGLLRVDKDYIIVDANKKIIDIFDLNNRKNIIGKNLFEIKEFSDKHFANKFKKVSFYNKIISGEFEYLNRNTKKIIINFKIKAVIDNKGFLNEFVIILQDITEAKAYEKKINYFTYHDSLTGLYNRNFLSQEINNIDVEENLPLSIIMGDINGLKLTNDAFGHQKGDKILRKTAEIIKEVSEPEDYNIRWGGDEFLIYLPRTSRLDVKKRVKIIRKKLKYVQIGPIKPTIALGFATKNDSEESLNNKFRQAEKQMYINKLKESCNTRNIIISSLKKTLNKSTDETTEHCRRMKEHVKKFAKALSLSEYKLNELYLLAELHDIGKIAISNQMTKNENSKLQEEECEKIKKHCELGYKIASSSPELSKIAEGILSHHEWWNGEGYPRGLKGKEIPLSARIIFLLDFFDNMICGSCYDENISQDTAVEELINEKGRKFDPDLVDVFVNQVLNKEEK